MSKGRRVALVASVLVCGAIYLPASSASAADNPYTASGVCGSGYTKIAKTKYIMSGTKTLGTVDLLYSSSSKKNCVVVLKRAYVGQATYTEAWIAKDYEEIPADTDRGQFKYYAVARVYAPGKCVQYSGAITAGNDWTDSPGGDYLSPVGWCD